jgi:hypothetical protein
MANELEAAARGPGRPRIEIDLVMLEALSQLGATNYELALHFGVSERTIDARRAEEPEFREAMERGFANGNISLRRKQMALAAAGNVTMLIWLGKQRLGQKDRVSQEHSGSIEQALVVELSALTNDELDYLDRLSRKACAYREPTLAALPEPASDSGSEAKTETPQD